MKMLPNKMYTVTKKIKIHTSPPGRGGCSPNRGFRKGDRCLSDFPWV